MKMQLRIQKGDRIHKFDCRLKITDKRILFDKIPFSKLLNAEIKAMRGYRWHGFEDPPIKKWSVENHPRNVFHLRALMGENPYEWFDRPLFPLEAKDIWRPEFEEEDIEINGAQVDMIRRALTYHYQIWGAEQGIGKSLAAIEVMERSGKKDWWYVGPKCALESVIQECKKWNLRSDINLTTMTYEGLVSKMRFDSAGMIAPDGVIFDESDYLKNSTTYRAKMSQYLADLIREQHGFEGYVLLLSGTPSAKNPTDWWSQCEIAWPGFLREGNFNAFEARYAVMEQGENLNGVKFTSRVGWNKDEVAELPKRYDGLATVYRKSKWLPDLPEKDYKTVRMLPGNKVLRVAKALCNVAKNTITGLTWLRALSSGFQYINKEVGVETCPVCEGTGEYEHPDTRVCPGCNGSGERPKYDRETRKVATPKDEALRTLLKKYEDHGRFVVAASFKGSIDRVLDICKEEGWTVACVDGRGWRCYDADGKAISERPLDLWHSEEEKVCWVGNPGSCRYGLTLTLAYALLFYDNSFSAVERLQMEDRIHRQSMSLKLGALIWDFVHLPVDQLVIDTLKLNKELEHLSLGVIGESIGLDEEIVDEELLDVV